MAILNTGIVAPTGGYQIERSLRFNSADSAYLNRTPASAGNRKTWTWSCWAKLGTSPLNILSCNSANSDAGNFQLTFSSGAFAVQAWTVNWRVTTQVLRDNSAWYHIIVAVDTTQATANNRIRVYLNGSEVTAFSTTNNPSQNADIGMNQAATTRIGAASDSLANFFNGYLTEINFIDGQALTPSDFGETDSATGVWKPKKFSGTYGTNGFYLNFSDNSNTTLTTLGKDTSGNGNNWTPNNFSVTAGAGNDSLVDTPTSYGTDTGVGGEVRGNYATWNPLDKDDGITSVTNGNLNVVTNGSNGSIKSTIAFPSGKWYWEVTSDAVNSGGTQAIGIIPQSQPPTNNMSDSGKLGYALDVSNTDRKFENGTATSYGTYTQANGAIYMLAFDQDAGKLWYGIDGTWLASGAPASGTNPSSSSISTSTAYCAAVSDNTISGTFTVNFGQRPFAYTAPSGFKALCTQNLPTPAIAKGNQYFDVLTWSGTGGSSGATRSITGLNFQPDFLWEKARSSGSGHQLLDVVRGVGQNKVLASNSTGAEPTPANTESLYGWLSSFNSDGFTTTNGTSTWDNWNKSGDTYVAWNWKAGGTGVTNTTGTITSTVSANTTAGFSIVVYTGNGIDGATVGHGLGVVPSMVIQKRRDGGIANWRVWHSAIYATSGVTDTLFLNSTAASGADGDNISGVSSTTFTTRGTGGTNPSGNSCVAYVFAAVPGYSAFGKYTGNGSADGSFIYLGFRPEFVIIKRTDSTGNWITYDAVRGTYNVNGPYVYSNSSATEATSTTVGLDFLSNGFKNRNTYNDANTSSATYIYMAFAENPFKYSLAR